MKREFELILYAELGGQRLDKAIAHSLSQNQSVALTPSTRQVKRWIEAGQIRLVGDEISRSSQRVQGGEHVLIDLALIDQSKVMNSDDHRTQVKRRKIDRRHYWQMVRSSARKVDPALVIARGNGWIALNKPSGIPTEPTVDPLRETLYHRVIRYLDLSSQSAAQEPYLRVVHRLDRGTSGIVMMSLCPRVTPLLAQYFEQRQVVKRYLLCSQRPKYGHFLDWIERVHTPLYDCPENTFSTFDLLGWARRSDELSYFKCEGSIGKGLTDDQGRERWQVISPHRQTVERGERSACTEVRLLSVTNESLYLEARPLTGRTHQIRVHLAHMAAPLWGDELYGGIWWPRLALHAWRLTLPDPSSSNLIDLTCFPPDDFYHLTE